MNDKSRSQEIIYLALVLGTCYVLGIIGLFFKGNGANPVFEILQKGFTVFPVLAAVITRRITRDDVRFNLSLRVWKNIKLWLFCALVPGVLIALSTVVYFLIFPESYSGTFYYGKIIGTAGKAIEISSPLRFIIIAVIISAVCFPIQLLELGEEIGWRGYLLPKQIKRYGIRKAVLINSALWGLAHMPLIYFGFNYSLKNPGAPWSNMALMMLLCMVLGTIISYVTIVSGNCMYAGIIHGVVNVIGEIPVFLCLQQESGLLGPNPTGLISMSGLIICAVVLFVKLKNVKSKLI